MFWGLTFTVKTAHNVLVRSVKEFLRRRLQVHFSLSFARPLLLLAAKSALAPAIATIRCELLQARGEWGTSAC